LETLAEETEKGTVVHSTGW